MVVEAVLLVHGAWHGAWCWERVIQPLEDAGLEVHAIDLPGHGDSNDPLGDLHGDADAVTAMLDDIAAPTLLVGHSYGGMVITDAGAHDGVEGLVYVCAFMPDAGASLMDEGPGQPPAPGAENDPPRPPSAVEMSDDGSRMSIDPPKAAATFYNDCDDVTATWATPQLSDQPTASFVQTPRRIAWQSKPATYVVCTDDRTIPPSNQRRMARHAGRVVELDAGHSPFLSMPDDLAAVIIEAATDVG